PVDGLERDLRQVLVRPVDRVPRLEADDAPPPAFGEGRSRVGGILRQLGECRLRPLEDRDAAREVERLLRVEARDARMRLLSSPEAALGLALLVVAVDLRDLEDGAGPAGFVGERDPV